MAQTLTNTQGFEHSSFFGLRNDYAGYIDFEGRLLPTDTEGGREVAVIVSFEVEELDKPQFHNDHSRPPLSAYMVIQEQEYVSGANSEISAARNIPISVEAARTILRTWGGEVEVK